MTIHAIGRLFSLWLMTHPLPSVEVDSEPLRIVGPGAPIESTQVHLGARFHSDAVGDAAITLQLTAYAISL